MSAALPRGASIARRLGEAASESGLLLADRYGLELKFLVEH